MDLEGSRRLEQEALHSVEADGVQRRGRSRLGPAEPDLVASGRPGEVPPVGPSGRKHSSRAGTVDRDDREAASFSFEESDPGAVRRDAGPEQDAYVEPGRARCRADTRAGDRRPRCSGSRPTTCRPAPSPPRRRPRPARAASRRSPGAAPACPTSSRGWRCASGAAGSRARPSGKRRAGRRPAGRGTARPRCRASPGTARAAVPPRPRRRRRPARRGRNGR